MRFEVELVDRVAVSDRGPSVARAVTEVDGELVERPRDGDGARGEVAALSVVDEAFGYPGGAVALGARPRSDEVARPEVVPAFHGGGVTAGPNMRPVAHLVDLSPSVFKAEGVLNRDAGFSVLVKGDDGSRSGASEGA